MYAFPWTSQWGGFCLKKLLMEFKVSHFHVIGMKNVAFVVSKNHYYLTCHHHELGLEITLDINKLQS